METPYVGRTIINDLYNGVEVVIPAKKNWFLFIYFGIYFFFGLIGSLVAPTILFSSGNSQPYFYAILFTLIPFVITFYGASILWWLIAGKEAITVTSGVLTIERKGAIFKTKSYDLTGTKNFRSSEEGWSYAYNAFRAGRAAPWIISKTGTVRFDYGMDTVRFGDRLSEPEGNYILEKLRNKKLI